MHRRVAPRVARVGRGTGRGRVPTPETPRAASHPVQRYISVPIYFADIKHPQLFCLLYVDHSYRTSFARPTPVFAGGCTQLLSHTRAHTTTL